MQSPDISEITKELEKVNFSNSPNNGKRKRNKNLVTQIQKTEKKFIKV